MHHTITLLWLYGSSSVIILLNGQKKKKTAPLSFLKLFLLALIYFSAQENNSLETLWSLFCRICCDLDDKTIITVPGPWSVIADILHISSLFDWLVYSAREAHTHSDSFLLIGVSLKVNETDIRGNSTHIDTHTYWEGNWFLQNTRRSKDLL